MIKKEVGKVNFSPCNRITAHVECKNKSDTSNNGGNWKHPQIIHKIPDEQTKSRITEHNHTGQCTHTAEVISETYVTREITFHNTINCKYRTVATLYTPETWFVSGI